MDQGDWTEAEVKALHQKIRDELRSLFDHDEIKAKALVIEWLAHNPCFSPDAISHEGPFNVALRVHYTLVEGGDPTSATFIEWRKRFHHVWEEGCEPRAG